MGPRGDQRFEAGPVGQEAVGPECALEAVTSVWNGPEILFLADLFFLCLNFFYI